MPADDWATIEAAAQLVGRKRAQLYAWLSRPAEATGIRRMRVGRTTFVHIDTLIDYESTINPVGRPRKDSPHVPGTPETR